jgi:hypothetical protein
VAYKIVSSARHEQEKLRHQAEMNRENAARMPDAKISFVGNYKFIYTVIINKPGSLQLSPSSHTPEISCFRLIFRE